MNIFLKQNDDFIRLHDTYIDLMKVLAGRKVVQTHKTVSDYTNLSNLKAKFEQLGVQTVETDSGFVVIEDIDEYTTVDYFYVASATFAPVEDLSEKLNETLFKANVVFEYDDNVTITNLTVEDITVQPKLYSNTLEFNIGFKQDNKLYFAATIDEKGRFIKGNKSLLNRVLAVLN